MSKTIVRVAWNREAADIMEEKGWKGLVAVARRKRGEISYDEVEFNTEAEAEAYVQGINDGNGWDSPYTEIIKSH